MGDVDPLNEFQDWLATNWDPDSTVRGWWERLGLSGWAAPSLPTDAYGRGLSPADSIRVAVAIERHGALAAPGGLGLWMTAATIVAHGTREQIDTLVADVVTGRTSWCQLFSEPAAGSDLAGLQTRAVRNGEDWIVNGQKVWTSLGQFADLGMLIARTDPDVPKHSGITFFVVDMHQPGVDVRPLREMTGRALFNEVFLDDVRVRHADIIGGLNNGWAVANSTLGFERSSIGAGGGHAPPSTAMPGTVIGDLDRRAGDFVRRAGEGGSTESNDEGASLFELARRSRATADPATRQDWMRVHTMEELARISGLRLRAAAAHGHDLPGFANLAKLSMSSRVRLECEVAPRLLGPAGTLHVYEAAHEPTFGGEAQRPADAAVSAAVLFAPAASILGGTDEIQRNILAERVLGMPKEPGPDPRTTPFGALPKNA